MQSKQIRKILPQNDITIREIKTFSSTESFTKLNILSLKLKEIQNLVLLLIKSIHIFNLLNTISELYTYKNVT